MRELCPSSTLIERGLAFRFTVHDGFRERQAIALRFEGRAVAYINECAHVPIELDFNPGDVFDLSRQYLICSTHGAYYDPSNGLCLGGPCPGRHLTPLKLVERDNVVWLIEEKMV
jgi:nitrite reductase/ring-hydroxylating ferredoxin subunit